MCRCSSTIFLRGILPPIPWDWDNGKRRNLDSSRSVRPGAIKYLPTFRHWKTRLAECPGNMGWKMQVSAHVCFFRLPLRARISCGPRISEVTRANTDTFPELRNSCTSSSRVLPMDTPGLFNYSLMTPIWCTTYPAIWRTLEKARSTKCIHSD